MEQGGTKMQSVQDEKTPTPGEISAVDTRMVITIKRILAKGNNAEVKGKGDGSYTIYEVKKNLA